MNTNYGQFKFLPLKFSFSHEKLGFHLMQKPIYFDMEKVSLVSITFKYCCVLKRYSDNGDKRPLDSFNHKFKKKKTISLLSASCTALSRCQHVKRSAVSKFQFKFDVVWCVFSYTHYSHWWNTELLWFFSLLFFFSCCTIFFVVVFVCVCSLNKSIVISKCDNRMQPKSDKY